MEEIHCEAQRGSNKRPQYQGSFSERRSGSQFKDNGSKGRYPLLFLSTLGLV